MNPYTLPLFDQLLEPSIAEGSEQTVSLGADAVRAAERDTRVRRRKRLSEGVLSEGRLSEARLGKSDLGKSDLGKSDLGKSEKHLAAARRISKSMWRLPDHSPEQTQAGQEICRHLLASLADWSDHAR